MTEQAGATQSGTMERWQRIARRIRVPLGFVTAALYLFELRRKPPHMIAIVWSLLLVLIPIAWWLNSARGDLQRLIVHFLDERAKEFGLIRVDR